VVEAAECLRVARDAVVGIVPSQLLRRRTVLTADLLIPGPLGKGPPTSSVLRDAPTPCHPSGLASFRSLGRTTPVRCDSWTGHDATPARPQRLPDGDSQVPGGPSYACPGLRPRRDRPCQAFAARRCCLPPKRGRRLPRKPFEAQSHGPRTRLSTPRPPGLLPAYARLASGRWLHFAGQDGSPCWVLTQGLAIAYPISHLLAQALPGAPFNALGLPAGFLAVTALSAGPLAGPKR